MGSAPPESLIHETLPYAAQWGLLGILLLVTTVAIVYLINKIFVMQDAHRAEVTALHVTGRDRESAVQDKRLKEAAEYAGVLAELGEVLAGNTADQQEIVKQLADILAADARTPRPRKGASTS